MTPEQQLARIYRTYSPPWVLWHSAGIFIAALPLPGAVRLIYARNPDQLARQLREADRYRPVTRTVSRREFLKMCR